jgi:hypothetical protein
MNYQILTACRQQVLTATTGNWAEVSYRRALLTWSLRENFICGG